jgi:hypothetical protein
VLRFCHVDFAAPDIYTHTGKDRKLVACLNDILKIIA